MAKARHPRAFDPRDPEHAALVAWLGRGSAAPPCARAHRDAYLQSGSHPDVVAWVWDHLGAGLPASCRCLVHGHPALLAPKRGVVVAVALGTAYALRVPTSRLALAHTREMPARRTYRTDGSVIDLGPCGANWRFGSYHADDPAWCAETCAELLVPRITRIPRSLQPIMPWQNGAGTTRVVAIDPPDASLATGFRWRVSIADVSTSGPFSHYPGVDRSLWLLHGDGMDLDVAGHHVRLRRPGERIDFRGELPVQATLVGGPTQDLNVMVTRGACAATAEFVVLETGSLHPVACTGTALVLALTGAVRVGGGGIETMCLDAGDAVRLDGACALTLQAASAARVTLLAACFGAS